MASNPGRKKLEARRRRLEKKYGKPFQVLVASNGEAAILPVDYIKSVTPRPTPANKTENP